MGLNERQREAVTTTEGPLLIVAGPGTGKTKTMVDRIGYLILDRGISPDRITITTFTRKAARELKSRISRMMLEAGREGAMVHAGNFHRLAGEIVDSSPQRLPYKPFFKLVDQGEQIQLLMERLPEFLVDLDLEYFFGPLEAEDPFYLTRRICGWMDKLREGFVDLDRDDEAVLKARKALNRYRSLLLEHNVMDYSGLLENALFLLRNHRDILESFQDRCAYLMVDEYQDTNPIQEQMIALLSAKTGNLCVVGDDDQSLYRFRGATVENLLGFVDRYPGAKTIYLRENYRSVQSILSFSTDFINFPYPDMEAPRRSVDKKRLSSFRFAKDLVSWRQEGGEGQMVRTILAGREDALIDRIVDKLWALRNQVGSFRQMAILSHSVKDRRMLALSSALRRAGIPIHILKEGNLLSFTEVKRFIACLALCFSDRLQSPSLKSGLNQQRAEEALALADLLPKRSRAETDLGIEKLRRNLTGEPVRPLDLAHSVLALPPFSDVLDRALAGDSKAVLSLTRIFSFIHYIKAFCEKRKTWSYFPEDTDRFVHEFFLDYLPFLSKLKPEAVLEEEPESSDEDVVNIMTIHQSKGLEFPIVFLMEPASRSGFSQKRIDDLSRLPVSSALAKSVKGQLAEELDFFRLYYTAFTRAKDLLVLCGVDSDPLGAEELNDYRRSRRGMADKAFSGINWTLPGLDDPSDLGGHWSQPVRDDSQESYAFTTDIDQYRKCPRRYFFIRRLKLPEGVHPSGFYGSMVHRCIELIHKRLLEGGEVYRPGSEGTKALIRRTGEGMSAIGAVFREEDLERACREIDRYLSDELPGWAERIFKSEYGLAYSTGRAIYEGQLDLLLDGGQTLVDFKTGRKPEEGSPVLAGYRDQLAFYRLLMERGGLSVAEGEWSQYLYFISEEDDPVELVLDRADLEAVENDVALLVDRMESGDFSGRSLDLSYCRTCPLNSYCNKEE